MQDPCSMPDTSEHTAKKFFWILVTFCLWFDSVFSLKEDGLLL